MISDSEVMRRASAALWNGRGRVTGPVLISTAIACFSESFEQGRRLENYVLHCIAPHPTLRMWLYKAAGVYPGLLTPVNVQKHRKEWCLRIAKELHDTRQADATSRSR